MRDRLDDKRLPSTFAMPSSESLERQFASLSAGINKRLEQIDVRIVVAEEAGPAVRSMRSIEKIAAGEARRL
jgi:predicted component of type VI protein secretion system